MSTGYVVLTLSCSRASPRTPRTRGGAKAKLPPYCGKSPDQKYGVFALCPRNID